MSLVEKNTYNELCLKYYRHSVILSLTLYPTPYILRNAILILYHILSTIIPHTSEDLENVSFQRRQKGKKICL